MSIYTPKTLDQAKEIASLISDNLATACACTLPLALTLPVIWQ